jgi:hypothetical protein
LAVVDALLNNKEAAISEAAQNFAGKLVNAKNKPSTDYLVYRSLSSVAPFCQVGPCPLIAVYDYAR